MSDPITETARAAETAARSSYGRLLAILAARSQDIAWAEDALADAFARALARWPETGVPDSPDAWLLTVARNRITDRQRHHARFPTESPPLGMDDLIAPTKDNGHHDLPDQRLALMLVCAHPAIAAPLHTPLMLQCVLGLDSARIAQLFMISPGALAKRLVRAKAKIRDAAISFALPDAASLPARQQAVFEAIYGLHTHDWLDPSDAMGDEALYLADLLCRLRPESAEAHGLAALIAFGHARHPARLNGGVLVPVAEQDTALWDRQLIAYATAQLRRATGLKRPGRFQTEAAIQSVHIARKDSGVTDWPSLRILYRALMQMAPTLGAGVAQAVVIARLHGATAGLSELKTIETQGGSGFQPLWAARADMLARMQDIPAAQTAYDKAISLSTDAAQIRFLRRQRAALDR